MIFLFVFLKEKNDEDIILKLEKHDCYWFRIMAIIYCSIILFIFS